MEERRKEGSAAVTYAGNEDYPRICWYEADALVSLGFIGKAIARHREALTILEGPVEAEPDWADFQWDLVVSLVRMVDTEPSNRPEHLTRAVEILRELRNTGRLFPKQERAMRALEQSLCESQG
jgi:hypothetical protein